MPVKSVPGIFPRNFLKDTNCQVATVTVVGGPVVPRPPEGWTTASADTFCGDYIRYTTLNSSTIVLQKCYENLKLYVPTVLTEQYVLVVMLFITIMHLENTLV